MPNRTPVQASVTFHDVAVYFLEEEWDRLKERQKYLYKMVMEEIHEALCSLGYSILNPDVLIRIKAEQGPDAYEHRVLKTQESKSVGCVAGRSDILLDLKKRNEFYNKAGFGSVKSGLETESLSEDEDEVNPDLLFRIKEEEEPCSLFAEDSEEEEGVDAHSTNYSDEHPELVIIVKKEPCDLETGDSDGINIPTCPAEDAAPTREANNVKAPPDHITDSIRAKSQTEKVRGRQKMGLAKQKHPAEETSMSSRGKPSRFNDVDSEAKTEEPLLTEGAQLGDVPVDWSECEHFFASRARASQEQGAYDPESVYKCQECDKTFSKNSNLLRHQRIHTGERPYKCNECDKDFLHKTSFIQHMRIHTGERPYKCTVCDKSFRLSSTLVYHITTHRDEKLFKCTECEKSFTLKSTLVNHLRVHTGERPFKCTECVKCFINLRNLQKHQRTHTGERPYTCPVCPKSFSNVSNQRRHQKTHTGEKPFRCPQCSKLFSQRSSLIKHQQMHRCDRPSKYICTDCEKTFTKNSSLALHQKTHTSERPFKCEVCDKTFQHSFSVTQHQRIHTGERPYQCSVCPRSFRLNSTLARHYQKHTAQVHAVKEES